MGALSGDLKWSKLLSIGSLFILSGCGSHSSFSYVSDLKKLDLLKINFPTIPCEDDDFDSVAPLTGTAQDSDDNPLSLQNFSPLSGFQFPGTGGGGTLVVKTKQNIQCSWTVFSNNATFLQFQSGSSTSTVSGVGAGVVSYEALPSGTTTGWTGIVSLVKPSMASAEAIAANPIPHNRQLQIVADPTLVPCKNTDFDATSPLTGTALDINSTSLSPRNFSGVSGFNFPASGGSGILSVKLARNSQCAWAINLDQSTFIQFTSATSGSGNGTVSYDVSDNTTASPWTSVFSLVPQGSSDTVVVPSLRKLQVTGDAPPPPPVCTLTVPFGTLTRDFGNGSGAIQNGLFNLNLSGPATCSWKVDLVAGAEWLSLVNTPATLVLQNSASPAVRFKLNPLFDSSPTSLRTGTILVTSLSDNKVTTLTVNQKGGLDAVDCGKGGGLYYPDYSVLEVDSEPNANIGFQISNYNPHGGALPAKFFVYTNSTLATEQVVCITIGAFTKPDHIVARAMITGGVQYNFVDTCRLRTSDKAGPPGHERPCDQQLRQFSCQTLPAGTESLQIDYSGVSSNSATYLQITGLAGFDLTPRDANHNVLTGALKTWSSKVRLGPVCSCAGHQIPSTIKLSGCTGTASDFGQ